MRAGFPQWVVANLKMFFRDKTTIFWSILFPILLMGLLGLGFGKAQTIDFRVGVVDEDGTAWSAELRGVLDNRSLPFTVTNHSDPAVARSALERGDLDLVLVVPPGYGDFMANQTASRGNSTVTISLPVYWGVSEQGSGAVAVQTLEKVLDSYFRARTFTPERLSFAPQAVNSKSLQYIDFLAPGIVAMSIMQNGVFGLSLFIVSAREKKILKRLQATPAGAAYILAGRIVPAVLISFIQSALLLTIAIVGFGVKITGSVAVLAITVGFGAVVFITLGFLVSSVSKGVDSAEALTNVITLPMFFLGGVFIPLDRLPDAIQVVAKAMPLTYFADALRNIMLHGAGFAEVALDIGVLAVFAVVVFALAVRLFRWE